jgi:6-phosphogluconate dehydrogenase
MRLGMVGLGRMGGNMAARLGERGHEVVGFDVLSDATDVRSLAELVAALPPPRVVWVMVPAGDPTESTVAELAELLDPGDVVVDGGNSNWRNIYYLSTLKYSRSFFLKKLNCYFTLRPENCRRTNLNN